MNFAIFRRMTTSVTAWVVAAGAAVSAGVLALVLLGSRIPEQKPSPAAAAAQVPSAADPSPAGASPADPSPAAAVPASVPPAASPPSTGPAAPVPSRAPVATRPAAPSPNSSPSTATAEKTFTTGGGTVAVRCDATGAYLVSWSPASGYQTTAVARGPAPSARVTFTAGARSVVVTVTCVSGQPHAAVQTTGDN